MSIGMVIALIKKLATTPDPEVITGAVDDYLEEHPEATCPIDDTAGEGDTGKVWSADKAAGEVEGLKEAIVPLTPSATSGDVGKFMKVKSVSGGKVAEYEFASAGGGGSVDLFYVTPEDYGAVGDGVTDDSQAVQDACDAGYAVYFASNKTYYLASTVTIDHDCHLFGGENTVIKTKTPLNGDAPNGIVITGTLKKATTLTGNYSAVGSETDNAGNRFELTDMTGIGIGDIMVITAEDQFYNYNRAYYYLGGTLMIADKDDDYLYTCDAMPWNIENTEDVSVKVYSAPVAIIENLHFESDGNTSGSYNYCLLLNWCKNSTVKNCAITNMDNGMRLRECVNTMVDCVDVSITPDTSGGTDHYGVSLYACSNTIVSRIASECANSCVDLSGHTPNMNTYFKNCMLFGSNRVDGLGMHENAYNTVVEDCVIGGMIGYGTLNVKRCRFVQRNKIADSSIGIVFRGSHNPDWARLTIEDCIFEGSNLWVSIAEPVPQNPIQAYNNVVGEIIVRNCKGGKIQCVPNTSTTILSNTVKRMILDNWRDCYELYHVAGNTIELLVINNCSFGAKYFINKHSGDTLFFDDIKFIRMTNVFPQYDRIFVDEKHGGQYYLKAGNAISFASSDSSARYVVCGKNIQPNKVADYNVGNVTGSAGNAISRTVNNTFSSALSVNGSGEIVFTQPSNSSAMVAIYPIAMLYAEKEGKIFTSCKLKNTGGTSAPKFKPFIAIIDAKTGLVTYRGNGTEKTASESGEVATHYRDVPANSIVMAYLYCSSPVQGSETTLSEFVTELMPYEGIETLTFSAYQGESRTGDGSLPTLDGLNNIATNASSAVSVKFNANLLI